MPCFGTDYKKEVKNKTDGRYKKNSSYPIVKRTEQDEILNCLKDMKISELKLEILCLECENKELKTKLKL